MRIADHFELSLSNLGKMKLRTFLTTFGVTIGIGALVAMVSFGEGMQKNITDRFNALELFNSITVLPEDAFSFRQGPASGERRSRRQPRDTERPDIPLDDQVLERLSRIEGVEAVFPDIRIPAVVKYEGEEEFRFIQVLPSAVASSKMIRVLAGKPYASDEDNSLIISSSLLRRFGTKDPTAVLGRKIILSSVSFDFAGFNSFDFGSLLKSGKLPFGREDYEFTIVAVADGMDFGGPSLVQSDIFIPAGTAGKIKRLPFLNIWDLLRMQDGRLGYSAVNVRVSAPRFVEPVKEEIRKMGFQTVALLDQFEQVRQSFIFLDMLLAAVGMIAIAVASLGIINTMVMSILERYAEIGVMKAVGAGDGDIKKIFIFESSVIGFMGGVFGLALGWTVSRIINRVVNYFLAKQGVPFIEYFSFPWWLLAGAVLFSVGVSLAAGIFPALRAARVDPVRALRHD